MGIGYNEPFLISGLELFKNRYIFKMKIKLSVIKKKSSSFFAVVNSTFWHKYESFADC